MQSLLWLTSFEHTYCRTWYSIPNVCDEDWCRTNAHWMFVAIWIYWFNKSCPPSAVTSSSKNFLDQKFTTRWYVKTLCFKRITQNIFEAWPSLKNCQPYFNTRLMIVGETPFTVLVQRQNLDGRSVSSSSWLRTLDLVNSNFKFVQFEVRIRLSLPQFKRKFNIYSIMGSLVGNEWHFNKYIW